ncbi:MAG: type II secretion system minor pseudopilin GspI [Xanthomonadaceae bacterium]|nr:type II secretion system minor pseudopilin GspI [Xanthomonadaceae bacterium]
MSVSMRPDRFRGFTLLEVLVALAVLALAMAALVRTASQETRSLADERERTLAQWVAANAIAETRLATPLPSSGQRSGEVEMGGRRWRWDLRISMATDEGIRRLEVAVRPVQDQQPLLTLTGFATP